MCLVAAGCSSAPLTSLATTTAPTIVTTSTAAPPSTNLLDAGVTVDQLRARPLSLPHLASGQRCPVTTGVTSPSPDLGPLLGSGPARPALGGEARLVIAPPANFGSTTWGGDKILWALAANVGPALIRGRQLDGDGRVGFDNSPTPAPEKILDPTGRTSLRGGWFDFPGSTRVEHPGCYGYQVDIGSGSTQIIFQAT